jgi:hypothetical protein
MTSVFLNHPVSTAVEWPRAESKVSFGAWEIVVFPPSPEHDASLHIDLTRSRLTGAGGMSVLNQLLSIASWLDDQYAVLLPGWSGNPVPCRPSRRTREFPTSMLDGWLNTWTPLASEKARLALALYREAVNMQHFHATPYAVLGFYRILELAWPDGKIRGAALEKQVQRQLAGDQIYESQLRHSGYAGDLNAEAIARHLYKECRQAVAHATAEPIINPDETLDQYQMSAAAVVLRPLVRQVVHEELNVSLNRWDQADVTAEA